MQLPKATQRFKSFICLEDNSLGELRLRDGRVVWVERYLAVGLAVTRQQEPTARSPFLSLCKSAVPMMTPGPGPQQLWKW